MSSSDVSAAPTEAPPTHRDIDLDRLAPVLAVMVVLLLPVARTWVLWSATSGQIDLNQSVSTSPLDWPLALLVAVQLVGAVGAPRSTGRTGRPPAVANLAVVLLAWLVISSAIHPSWRALDLAFRIAGIWALIRTARRSKPAEQDALLGSLALVGTAQALLGIAQSRTGDVLGVHLFEYYGPLYTFGDATAGRGSLTHPYHLTALLVTTAAAAGLLVVRRTGVSRLLSAGALAVIGVAIPLTFSRAVVLAVVPMVVLWCVRRSSRLAAGALAGGLVLGVVLGLGGIDAKAEQTLEVDTADSGRRDRLAEAWRLMEEEPVFGVGPGRYVIELQDVEHDDLLPAHNVVAQAAAETGVPGALMMIATLVAFGAWLVRRRPMTIAVGISLLPFHLLDSYPHMFPVGLVITGLWLATVAIAADLEAR